MYFKYKTERIMIFGETKSIKITHLISFKTINFDALTQAKQP